VPTKTFPNAALGADIPALAREEHQQAEPAPAAELVAASAPVAVEPAPVVVAPVPVEPEVQGVQAEAVEALFASFLSATANVPEKSGKIAVPPTAEARPKPPARADRADRTPARRVLVDDFDAREPSVNTPVSADPRLVALQLLEEAEIYRRFGQTGEARQCVVRARQVCPRDPDVVRRAQALMAAIRGTRA
jgi:hypothetical protein